MWVTAHLGKLAFLGEEGRARAPQCWPLSTPRLCGHSLQVRQAAYATAALTTVTVAIVVGDVLVVFISTWETVPLFWGVGGRDTHNAQKAGAWGGWVDG